MVEAEQFLKNSRKCFLLAGAAREAKGKERYAAMGRDYLQLAHDAAKVKPIQIHRATASWGSLP
jgi:hypothetical protein